MGFRVSGLRFGGLGLLEVEGVGFGVRGVGFRVWGKGFGVKVFLGFRVEGLGFRVWSLPRIGRAGLAGGRVSRANLPGVAGQTDGQIDGQIDGHIDGQALKVIA